MYKYSKTYNNAKISLDITYFNFNIFMFNLKSFL